MNVLFGIFFFIFGTIIGSFLNVVILRYNTGKGLNNRSACASCGKTLSPLELIPLLSFIALRGACQSCGSTISKQYPLVEFLTGAIFLGVFLTAPSVYEMAFMLVVASLLIVIVVYDLKHKVIPNGLVYLFIALSLVSLGIDFATPAFALPQLTDAMAGIILALPIWILWRVSGGTWIGLGDAKLFLGVGWLLGLSEGVTAFMFSFWIGAAVSVSLLFFSKLMRKRKLNLGAKDLTMKTEIPFAPFIVASFFIVYFLHYSIISFLIS